MTFKNFLMIIIDEKVFLLLDIERDYKHAKTKWTKVNVEKLEEKKIVVKTSA